jgi:hypothetical protein
MMLETFKFIDSLPSFSQDLQLKQYILAQNN